MCKICCKSLHLSTGCHIPGKPPAVFAMLANLMPSCGVPTLGPATDGQDVAVPKQCRLPVQGPLEWQISRLRTSAAMKSYMRCSARTSQQLAGCSSCWLAHRRRPVWTLWQPPTRRASSGRSQPCLPLRRGPPSAHGSRCALRTMQPSILNEEMCSVSSRPSSVRSGQAGG